MTLRPYIGALLGGLLVALAPAPHRALAQGSTAGDSLLAAGDTAGALTAYMSAVASDERNAEAHYRAGLLHRARGDGGKAEENFRFATRFEPDSAKYWLALADELRGSGSIFTRRQVPGLIERAREAAQDHGSARLADIEYRAALVDWQRYGQLANRYLFIGAALMVDQGVLMGDWDDLETFFQVQVKPDPGDPGGADRAAAEEHLRAALSADPRHVDAAGLLAVLLGEQDRWNEAYDMARALQRAAPDSGRAWAVLGLALVRQFRWREAQAVFDTAIMRMTPAQRAPYANLGPILKTIDQVRFSEMSEAERRQLETVYWAVTQPLFLNQLNEPRTEFFARLTYVNHRWSDPFRGVHGWESDRGSVYLRYGPPDIWASFGRGRVSQIDPTTGGGDPVGSLESERNIIAWVYTGSQLRFMFSMTPGFSRATFAGDFRSFYNEVRNLFPVRFDNVPAVAEMDTILVQFVQFRGEGAESTELGIYTFMPIGRMARGATTAELQLTTAAVIRDGRMRDVRQDRREEIIKSGDPRQVERRSFRFELQPDQYLLRAEARLAEVERAARSTSVLNVRSYGGDSLMLSDLLLAERVAPQDSAFERWTDFFVLPSAGRFAPNAPVALLWEVYNLEPDSTGVARYTVTVRITIREVERRGFIARILGGIGDAVGLSAQGDDEVSLSYDREVTIEPGGRQVEYLTVELEDAPKALYGIWITVTDAVSGQAVTARRQFMVTDTPLPG